MSARKLFPLFLLAALCILSAIAAYGAQDSAETASCPIPSPGYATIQSAIDDSACTEILVGPGTFYETLSISRSLTLRGTPALDTVINGSAAGSVISIVGETPAATVITVGELTIVNGVSSDGGGLSIHNATVSVEQCTIENNVAGGWGGGLFAGQSDVTIVNSTITNNSGGTGGGLFFDTGDYRISGTTISHNTSNYHGGGLFTTGTVHLESVNIHQNVTQVDGGGIFNIGTLTIDRSGINANRSEQYSGGGIRNEGTLYVNASTISSNSDVLDGGGISNWSGTIRLNNATIVYNGTGGGVDNYDGNVRVQNSIIVGNNTFDCKGTIYSDGYNLLGSEDGCVFVLAAGDRVGLLPNLGSLATDLGFHRLKLGHGIDEGNPDGCLDAFGQLLETDQRGFARVRRCDIGAVEYLGQIHRTYVPACQFWSCPDFSDDFSDENSGWPVGEDEYVEFEYLSGEYRVRSKNDQYIYIFSAPTCNRLNYDVSVDARWASEPGSSYGLLFGIAGDFEHYYLFDINTDYEMYRLYYRAPDGWQSLVEPTQHSDINQGTESNQLRAVRTGTSIELFVNGTHLHSLTDSHIGGDTTVGIVASPYTGVPDSDARFDNFEVTGLPGNSDSSVVTPETTRAAPEAMLMPTSTADFIPTPDW